MTDSTHGLTAMDSAATPAHSARNAPASLERLIAEHQPRVERLAYRLLGWSDDVGDVVQDVFVRALRGRRRFRSESSVSTWLTRITINACRSHRRRSAVRRVFTPASADEATAEHHGEDAHRDERCERVRDAIRALPLKYREVVVLRYLEDLPVREVAKLLAVRRNAVEVRLLRARKYLRSDLKPLMDDSP